MVAVFVIALLPTTVATIASVTDAPLPMVPTLHSPVPAVYEPWLGVAVTNVSPAGRRSVTVTPVAVDGPVFVNVIVNVTLFPMIGIVALAFFARARLACCGVSVTVAELLP